MVLYETNGLRSLSVAHAAERASGELAVLAGDRVVSWRDLLQAVSGASAWLATQGIVHDAPHHVALVAHPNLATLITVLALMERGHVVLPIHARLTPRERSDLLDEWKPNVTLEDLPLAFEPSPEPLPPAPPDDERPLAIVATSGSSGRPRGVVLSRASFAAAASASARNLGWEPADRWLMSLSLAHVGGLSVVTRSVAGARAIVLPNPGAPPADVLEQGRVTLLSLVPTQLGQLLDTAADRGGRTLPEAVRAVLVGGAHASEALRNRAREARIPALYTYGLTEACSQVATVAYADRFADAEGVGKPLEGVEVRTHAGEILVRGATIASRYHPIGPDVTDEDGWLHTGDAGELESDGTLIVHGRLDARISTGGESVDPSEVEPALERIPGVLAACVVGRDDETWGQVILAALVVDADFDRDDFAKNIRVDLAPHRRPRWLALVDELPTTANGKVDRARVRALTRENARPVRGG